MSFVYLRLSSSDSYSKSFNQDSHCLELPRSTLVTRAIARRYTTAPATRNNAATNACIGFKTIVLIHRKKIAQQNTTGAGRKTLYGLRSVTNLNLVLDLCNCGSRRLNTRTPSTVIYISPRRCRAYEIPATIHDAVEGQQPAKATDYYHEGSKGTMQQ
jgi:hypothetical protein